MFPSLCSITIPWANTSNLFFCLQMLSQLHVERLVLPAISERSELWQSLFGFSEMSSAERLELLRFPFLGFQGTTMFQKILSKIIPRMEMRGKFAGAS